MSFHLIYSRLRRRKEEKPRPTRNSNRYELLAISPDTRFLATLLHSAGSNGWIVRWARSIGGAVFVRTEQSFPVIIYDCCSPTENWAESITRLKLTFEDSCLVMAAGVVSEELWQKALARGVYDVVSRSDNGEHLAATLRFARDWRAARSRVGSAPGQHTLLTSLKANETG